MKKIAPPFSPSVSTDTYAQSQARMDWCRAEIAKVQDINIPGTSNAPDWKERRIKQLTGQIKQAQFHQQVKANIFCGHCDFEWVWVAIHDTGIVLTWQAEY